MPFYAKRSAALDLIVTLVLGGLGLAGAIALTLRTFLVQRGYAVFKGLWLGACHQLTGNLLAR